MLKHTYTGQVGQAELVCYIWMLIFLVLLMLKRVAC
jgi:hypothetical protein